ncbi:MAG: GntR family transcriptional regulator [Solobacterium sp.]|nr:GntR family transcriptional regulator [Solobacterium sp.]
MDIYIDNRSGIPIYTQIYTQIKDQIISGAVSEDEPLPSIRSLAKDLRISVITTKRAYEELEREGYLYTVAGKGCFAAGRNSDLIREDNLRKIEADMEEIRSLASSCSLSREEILEMWNTIWEDTNL